jgi:folate-binding protein YgfZ
MVADRGAGQALLTRLERFKLRTKCDLALETVDVRCVRAAQPEALDFYGAAVDADGALAAVPLLWPTLAGVDLFGTAIEGPDHGSPELVEALRIAAGIPCYGREFDDDTIPAELGVVAMSTSFDKGCYVGQELVARMDSRGSNAPRRLMVLCGRGAAPQLDDAVHLGDAVAGALTSIVAVSDGWLAMASIKRAAVDADELIVGPSTAHRFTPLT